MRRTEALPALVALVALLSLAAVAGPAAQPASAQSSAVSPLERGYEAYSARAEGRQGTRASDRPILEAIAAFEEALANDPLNLEARTGLMRALFFRGEHVLVERKDKLPIFEQGRALAEDGIAQLTADSGLDPRGGKNVQELIEHLRDEPRAVGVYFFAAVHWGLWGQYRGKIAAAKQGVAGKIRDYASIVIALDDTYEAGGGSRILGRLHAEAPKLPFVTGWVDRKIAIAELEKAHRADPNDALSLLYLTEALLEYDQSRSDEAIELLEKLTTKEPNPKLLVEELQAIADGKKLLAEVKR